MVRAVWADGARREMPSMARQTVRLAPHRKSKGGTAARTSGEMLMPAPTPAPSRGRGPGARAEETEADGHHEHFVFNGGASRRFKAHATQT